MSLKSKSKERGKTITKRILTLLTTGVLAIALGGCGLLSKGKDSTSSNKSRVTASAKSRSLAVSQSARDQSVANSQHEEDVSRGNISDKSSASSVLASPGTHNQYYDGTNLNQEPESSAGPTIHNDAQAIQAAINKFGDNDGDWTWGVLTVTTNSQGDKTWHLKATSASSTTMTKWAMNADVTDTGEVTDTSN